MAVDKSGGRETQRQRGLRERAKKGRGFVKNENFGCYLLAMKLFKFLIFRLVVTGFVDGYF